MTTYFISDLHISHKNIVEYAQGFRPCTQENHDQWIIDQWNSVVNKRDKVFVLGDVSFSKDGIKLMAKMNGNKSLVLGNHDFGDMSLYTPYFQTIHGLVKYKGFWLSHAPIQPENLRDKFNLCGHVHQNSSKHPMHINVCVEVLNGIPMSLEQAMEIRSERLKNELS
jgi:calcineurin-like phosphoesterase family protein